MNKTTIIIGGYLFIYCSEYNHLPLHVYMQAILHGGSNILIFSTCVGFVLEFVCSLLRFGIFLNIQLEGAQCMSRQMRAILRGDDALILRMRVFLCVTTVVFCICEMIDYLAMKVCRSRLRRAIPRGDNIIS